jgi:hypothetical protein
VHACGGAEGSTGALIEGYQLKSMNGFAEMPWHSLQDKVYFDRSPQDGRIRLLPKEDPNSTKLLRQLVYPLDRKWR